MALFSADNAKSTELPAAYDLADRLSECDAFWDIVETTSGTNEENTATARALVTIGDIWEPLDHTEFTKEELQNQMFYVRIASGDEDGFQSIRSGSVTECPNEGGEFEIYIRRQVREAELHAKDGRSDVFRFFWDRIAAIQHQLFEAVQAAGTESPRITDVTRSHGPTFNKFSSTVSHGNYIWTVLMVSWGQLDRGGE